MSEIIDPTTEPIDIPLNAKMQQWFNKLKNTGVSTELECGECGTPIVVSVPRDEAGDENQKTICRSCITDM